MTKNSFRLSPLMAIKNMLLGANHLNIPFYPIDEIEGIFSYGQGKNSVFFNLASSQFDSQIGGLLQSDKSKTNMYLNLLGYKTTEQKVASSLEQCHEIADQLGFPLVIKPINGAKGNGVSANITKHNQIAGAFKIANINSNNRVIVEKFVIGDAHRITVSNNDDIIGVACIYPPFVIGNGKHNILELIAIENKQRAAPENSKLTLKEINLDAKMLKNLQDIGMNELSIPEKSARIDFLHTSNADLGGKVTIIDLDDIHPDNKKMAIDITKSFKLSCAGIDFITPDITKSWREAGAVIEVNCHPGVGERLVEGILTKSFSDRNDGRIDSTLVVTNNDNFTFQVIDKIKTDHLKIGHANANNAFLNGDVKRTGKDELY
ncbi:MAG: ATP-grasp domain-containing protein, partial [Emcibacteraceae bacterium]|nr:ATP-grasp domain-containing protein [Emcibacteraceae bacterium]